MDRHMAVVAEASNAVVFGSMDCEALGAVGGPGTEQVQHLHAARMWS